MWKRISSKEILTHPRLTVIEDRVRLPNGTETDYLRFQEIGDAATVICRNATGQILLQKEYSYPQDAELFQFPGGFVPKGEDPAIGANRELAEEEGLNAKTLVPLGSYLMNHRRSSSRMYVYLATDFEEKSLPADLEEAITSRWVTEGEIDDLIRKGQISNVHVLAPWSLYKLKAG
jgi:ADP-ribose pyrophosphatase YjhB (NUDIX family)